PAKCPPGLLDVPALQTPRARRRAGPGRRGHKHEFQATHAIRRSHPELRVDPALGEINLLESRLLLLDGRGEDLLHDAAPAPAGRISRALGVAPAVRPDRVHDAAEGCYALVIALLIAVVDALAGEQTVAVVLVRLRVCDAEAGREADAVTRLR